MIECRDHKHRDKCYRGQRLYDVLAPLPLGAQACMCPPLEELRIVLHQVEGDRQHRHGKQRQKNPRLPVIKSPRRKEDRSCEHDEQLDESDERSFVCLVHLAPAAQSLFERVSYQLCQARPGEWTGCRARGKIDDAARPLAMNPETQPNSSDAMPGLGGLRVVAFESRMAAEVATMIERRGGVAMVAPAMREVPLEDNHAALDFADRLLGGEFEVVIFMTGVGTRALFAAMETRHQRAALVPALAAITTVARGPKAIRAMRDLGIEPSIVVPEPNTWREVLSAVASQVQLKGKHVAVQEYGVSNHELTAGLEARGARVTIVPVYRWTLPADR